MKAPYLLCAPEISLSRRGFLKGAAALAASWAAPVRAQASDAYFVYIGTYTGRGQGIYVYRMDPASARLTLVTTATGVSNPSFVTVDPQRRFLYSVNEIGNFEGRRSGSVSSFAIDPAAVHVPEPGS